MFSYFKTKDTEMVSPVDGEILPMSQVKDAVFAEKMMGDGVAFQLSSDVVCSPCDGVVVMIAHTKHAIGLRNTEGIEILIHIGLDTVNLQGKGFTCLVKADAKIKKGQPLMQLDKAFFASENIDLTTPMIITNTNDFTFSFVSENKKIQTGDTVITYKKA